LFFIGPLARHLTSLFLVGLSVHGHFDPVVTGQQSPSIAPQKLPASSQALPAP
jgi:hypothetical protein